MIRDYLKNSALILIIFSFYIKLNIDAYETEV